MPRRIVRELKALGFWAVTLSLSGCIGTGGIAPWSSKLPDANQLATGPAIAEAEQAAGWPQGQWWKAYRDPQLDRWIDLALQGSPTLAMAAARVRQAKSAAGVAESAESLHATGDMSLKRHQWPADQFYGPGDLNNARTWDNNAAVGLAYDLDLWGRDRNATEKAVDLAHMTVAEARQAQLELVDNIVQVYIGLSLDHARRDIAEARLEQQKQILDLAERRLRGGIGSQFEVSEAQVPLPESHRQIDAIDESIALAHNQLAALAGKGPGEAAAMQRPSLKLDAPLGLPSSLPAQLLGQRPDVVASRWQVAAQARGIDVAHAGFYPNVDLTASIGFVATGGGMLSFLTGPKFNYTAGPAISLPIFDGGRLRGELGEASAGYDMAVAHYQQTLANALKDVSDQLIRRESMEKQKGFADESLASAQKANDIAMVAFQRGLTDYLHVLNAQTVLLHQREVVEQVAAERLAVQANLITALGGGLGAGADSPAQKTMQAPATPALLRH